MIQRLQILLLALLLGAGSLPAQELVSIESKGSRALWQLQLLYGDFIQYGIDMYKVTYTTPDAFGALDTASGLLVVPILEEESALPLLVYQHGTVTGPSDVPSNLQGGWELAAITGGMGYASLAPDYLGLGESRGFHPYVHAATEASAGLDMIRAVKSYAPEMDLYLNEQLFLTGYSQGGHASMALHRSLELDHSDEFTVTAASHLSGPYSISGTMRDLILSDEAYGYVAYLPNTILSYHTVYGLYEGLDAFFKPDYLAPIEQYFNREISLFSLNIQLINQLTNDYGSAITKGMLQDSIITILTDEPDHPINQALRDNDVYEWAPQQPTRIFYCEGDDQVPYRNSVVADSVMQLLGAADLVTMNLNSTFDHGECVEPAMLQTIIFFGQYQEITVNTPDLSAEASVRLFPNPVDDLLTIKDLPVAATAQLFDLQGRPVLRQALAAGTVQLKLDQLPAGIYLLRLEGEGFRNSQRIIVE